MIQLYNLVLLFLPIVAFAESSAIQERTIPFIIEQRVDGQSKISDSEGMGGKDLLGRSQMEAGKDSTKKPLDVVYFPISSLKALLQDIKNELCPSVNEGGKFEVTFKMDASAKILGIGASGESGFKATIKCDKGK